jgi:hypothetical protein
LKRPTDTTPSIGRGSVSAGEVLTLREFGRRLGLANKALCDCQKSGLKTALVGRVKFVCGSHAIKWFHDQAERQAGDQAGDQAGANGQGGKN